MPRSFTTANCCNGEPCTGGICPKPISCIKPETAEDGRKCWCIDGTPLKRGNNPTCSDACRDNCLVADTRIWVSDIPIITGFTAPRKYKIPSDDEAILFKGKAKLFNASITAPLIISAVEDCQIMFDAKSFSTIYYNGAARSWDWDKTPPYNGVTDSGGPGFGRIVFKCSYFMEWWSKVQGDSVKCKKKMENPYKYAWVCPILFSLTDTNPLGAVTEKDIVWFGVEKSGGNCAEYGEFCNSGNDCCSSNCSVIGTCDCKFTAEICASNKECCSNFCSGVCW
ncbi:MAG: hypothetical protein AEth_00655 [Candidatus Argoarchaeum ethanivorans]|uniref:Uncharacterized protein n=1 Tax=Candidatus Argoarchaeum ethanivorans TaxID=2608793 RepID=A0A8B3S2H5_9EURY|nr:MAG: hypothetical protein AEth_00655 [Candidatus Argoarchaeum ethanivorans]